MNMDLISRLASLSDVLKINMEKICLNCKFLAWAVAIGQGARCTEPRNKVEGKAPMIPSRKHTCKYFEPSKTKK